MSNFYKSILCNIPRNFILLYYKNENLLIMKSNAKYLYTQLPLKCRLLIFKSKVFLKFDVNCNIRQITNSIILVKRAVYAILVTTYKKLNIVGVGFKVVKLTKFLAQVLVFKLGFSHSIYIQIKNDISIFCVELSKLFIVSNFIDNVLNIIFLIKYLKSINVYNGKGILFYNEKKTLKIVKK